MKELVAKGTKAEQELFMVVRSRYDRSGIDLNTRINDFDKKDELFRTFIDEAKWPYRAQVADPATFTFIVEKTSRLISNKLKGKVVPREGSDWLKAKVANALLDYYWDEATKGGSMIRKWALMDTNCRKYGASFGLVKWDYETRNGKTLNDNPEFEALNNRDVLVNPDHPEVKEWFQHRRYVTIEELQRVNDIARTKPVYKNLDILRQSLKDIGTEKGDRRDVNWISRNKAMMGLVDTLGEDKYTKYIEVVTEYRKDKFVTFAPKHGIILREAENPWDEIPIIHLRYYVIDDDIYGLSEIEPIEKLQRVENALISQYLDTINNDLYPPLLVRATGVQMHTLEFGPNKKWLMNDPNTDIKRFETSTSSTSKFTATVSFIISRMQSALGESGQGVSNIDPFQPDKTATEIRDTAMGRMSRDNYNQIFLAEALKKQMLLWLKMAARFLNKNKMIQIVGEDTLQSFKKKMMAPSATDMVTGQPIVDDTGQPAGPLSPYGPNEIGVEAPIYPVRQGNELVPKFQLDETGEMGELIVEPKDLAGLVDYIPDVESMSIQKSSQSKIKFFALQLLLQNPTTVQMLAQEGMKPRVHDLIVEMLEDSGFRDARRFFEEAPAPPPIQPGQEQIPGQAPQLGAQTPENKLGTMDQRNIGGGTTRESEQNKIGAI